MKFFISLLLSAAILFSYMHAFGGALFYENFNSQKFNSIARSISFQGRQAMLDNAVSYGINSALSGKNESGSDFMPSYILDENLIAVKVNDSYAGMHFPNEAKIDIPILRNAYVFLGVLVGSLAIIIL